MIDKLLRYIIEGAFYSNQHEYMNEIRKIFQENEYSINDRTKVVVRGFFDKDECLPYVQFVINTDEVNHATEFYRYNYGRTNNKKIDELKVLENEDRIVEAIYLAPDDLKA